MIAIMKAINLAIIVLTIIGFSAALVVLWRSMKAFEKLANCAADAVDVLKKNKET